MLGARHVEDDPATIAAYERATFPTSQRVIAVVRPGTVAATQRVLAVASRERVPIYPVSRGFNWGYGSRVPREDGSVVLELSRLRRISALDDELGTVTVQAGVSFAELAAFLARRGSSRMLTVTGGTPRGSVVANALERGIGFGVGGNRIETVCALEVVLATGELIRTGFARYPRARAAHVHRAGLGPSFDGLFAQSNLGITTSATLWLPPRPRWAGGLSIRIRHRDLAPAIAIYRALLGAGALRGVVKLSNAESLMMAGGPNVDRRARGWIGYVHISGDDLDELAARLDYLERSFTARSKLVVQRTAVTETARIVGPYGGVPGDYGLAALAYGRPPMPPGTPLEPSGAVFVCPAVPLRGDAVKEVVELLSAAARAGGFVPYVTLNLMDERAVHVVFGVFYDRDAPGLDRRAMQVYRRALAACVARGYYPYRLGIQSMQELPPFVDATAAVLARIRGALDPAGILGRGTYEGGPSRAGRR